MTPLELSICIHYYSSVEDMPWLLGDAPCQVSTLDRLMKDGLLVDAGPEALRDSSRPQRYRSTQKLNAFVSMLKDTPLPKMMWTDPRTDAKITGHLQRP